MSKNSHTGNTWVVSLFCSNILQLCRVTIIYSFMIFPSSKAAMKPKPKKCVGEKEYTFHMLIQLQLHTEREKQDYTFPHDSRPEPGSTETSRGHADGIQSANENVTIVHGGLMTRKFIHYPLRVCSYKKNSPLMDGFHWQCLQFA